MRKAVKEQLLDLAAVFKKINFKCADVETVLDVYHGTELMLSRIEESEGEKHIAVTWTALLQELLEHLYSDMTGEESGEQDEVYLQLQQCTERLYQVIEEDIKIRKEIVFMPYKAAMWDSLESVWMAADADPECDAYVVPMPYYDRNKDQSFGEYHYEGDLFPPEVPITHYQEYDLEERRPDVIYIHNPYDNANAATSVDPQFYSKELKKYTDCLVYIPYYSTTGGMAEAQAKCVAYYYVDYIVTQASKYRKFFDPELPDEKFLPLGSPKFDRVIRICNNPPESPEEWRAQMEGKKVYFYNTSLGGMLADTENFFKKMQYVFDTFRGRADSCILWRPHPLFETTIDSMRPSYRPMYDELKEDFISNRLGIYDDTPDITNSIAWSDAYIGDAGTSVTSLFGIAGKPIFVLNNRIHTKPEEDDWRGDIIRGFSAYSDNDWLVTRTNQLYHAPNGDFDFHYVCDLCKYADGGYYCYGITIDEKTYICPANAQDIVVIENEQMVERITLERHVENPGAFYGAIAIGTKIYLLPLHYPKIVCYDTETQRVSYIEGYNQYFVKMVNGEWRVGGCCAWKDKLLIASPDDDKVVAISATTGKVQVLSNGTTHRCGCLMMAEDGDIVWMLPFTGKVIIAWNPKTGERREYTDFPDGFTCRQWPLGFECEDRPLDWPMITSERVYFPAMWGNMDVELDRNSGEMKEWHSPLPIPREAINGYYNNWSQGSFLKSPQPGNEDIYRFFSLYDTKVYEGNIKTGKYQELPVSFDRAELREHEPGFAEQSDWMKYCCNEGAFNSLEDFLRGEIAGQEFDREKQVSSYGEITANADGRCGEKVHRRIFQ